MLEGSDKLLVCSLRSCKQDNFERIKGTPFVLIKSPDSSAKIGQIDAPRRMTRAKDFLEHVKKKLPDENVVQATSFNHQ